MKKTLRQRKDQLAQIYEAFSQDSLPVNEPWYQERLAACASCSYNSENVPKENKSFLQNIRENVITCPQVRYCTACHCCIDQKASIKRAQCGLVEIGKSPKWDALEVFTADNSNVALTHTGEKDYIIRNNGSIFFLDLGATSDPVVDFSFELFVPIQHEFITTRVTCGCTVSEHERIDDARIKFRIRLSTVNFMPGGITSRTFYADYKNKTVEVKFQIEKLNPIADELPATN